MEKKSVLKKVEEKLEDVAGVLKKSADVVITAGALVSAVKVLKSETAQEIVKALIKH